MGDVVSAGGSVALGTVTDVSDTTSTVTLYSAPGSDLAAELTHMGVVTPLQLMGQGGGSFMSELPANTVVAVGDQIVFPGLDATLPATVSAVVAKSGESFLTIYAHLPVNLFALRYVEVMTNAH